MVKVGVKGSRRVVSVVEMVKGIVGGDGGRRQGVVPARLFGDIVRVIEYESRR